MIRVFHPYLLAIVFAISAVSWLGCGRSGPSVSTEVLAAYRAQLLLTEEPDGVQTVLDVRETLLGTSGESTEHDHDHEAHEDKEHAEHDHDEHAEHDHAEGDHDENAEHDHDAHDHDEHTDHDEHAGHDNDEDAEHDHEHHAVEPAEPTGPQDVVMVGQIGGLANPWEASQPEFPFSKNETLFFLADLGAIAELETSGHNHAPGEECSFCAAHADDNSTLLAMVRFLGKDGAVLHVDARQLFDVKETDTVVVQGWARIVEGGMMVVDATGLYIRR